MIIAPKAVPSAIAAVPCNLRGDSSGLFSGIAADTEHVKSQCKLPHHDHFPKVSLLSHDCGPM